ncbi:MAG: hypothetical protein D6694_06645 [Gammaproteobacteria bacterium]|nr:MAG: hypothetical protein D6694_06645 [Gammaproteobacteria bacterium]
MTQQGRSLLEMLCVLFIIGVITQNASASWSWLVAREQLASLTNHLMSELRFAQHQALVHQTAVTWCASPDKQHCSNDWHNLRLVFIDKNRDQERQPDEPILKQFDALTQTACAVWRSFRPRPGLTYTSTGMTDHQNGTFTLCIKNNNMLLVNQLVLTKLGRLRVVTQPDIPTPPACAD